MKYFVIFPQTSGQYAGWHRFSTVRSRTAFLERAIRRGYKDFSIGEGRYA